MDTAYLTGRTAIVTGGGRGIGLGITRALLAGGANVAVVGRSTASLQALAELGSERVLPITADVSRSAACDDITAKTRDAFGGVDIVCANAGIFPEAPVESMTDVGLEEVFRTNVFGTIALVRSAVPMLRTSTHARIVITSSITGPITGYPGWSHYGASKAAQLGFMRSAALELAPWQITVNAVLPGNIVTQGLTDMGPGYIEAMTASVPLGRLGTIDDIGSAVAFLCSDGAAFITGHSLVVDGGQILPECPDAILEATRQELS